MGRGLRLSSEERAVILALKKDGLGQRAIAKRVNRSKTAIQHVLATDNTENRTTTAGPKPKLSATLRRLIIRTVLKERLTASQVQKKMGLSVSIRTIQRILQQHSNLHYVKMQPSPHLTQSHRTKRLKWGREMIVKDAAYWRKVTFTDEKRWCLDGPDGFNYYWADNRLSRDVFSKRVNGGGSLMIWAGVSWRGKTELAFISNKIDAVHYCSMLDRVYQPYVEKHYPKGGIFQQDGAPAHTAVYTRDYFMMEDMLVIDWPPKSPDINIIENVWSILARRVYQGGRVFDDVSDLKECLLYEWDKLTIHEIRNLIESVPRRIVELIVKRGGETKY